MSTKFAGIAITIALAFGILASAQPAEGALVGRSKLGNNLPAGQAGASDSQGTNNGTVIRWI